MPLAADFQALLDELEELRRFKAGSQDYTGRLERNLDAAEAAIRTQREELGKLRARPGMIDGPTEDMLWRLGATIEFKTALDGNRSIKISGAGRRLALRHGGVNGCLLREALEDARGAAPRSRS